METPYQQQRTESMKLSEQKIDLTTPSTIGVGKTADLSLRVSAACLTLMVIQDGERELALFERVIKIGEAGEIRTQLQPIGGAAGILNCHGLEAECGSFNFDSDAAARESDLRIFIKPEQWTQVRELLKREFSTENTGVIENSPLREIQEEIGDLLGISIDATALSAKRVGCHFQDKAKVSARVGEGQTVRAFAIDEVNITSDRLASLIQEYCSDNDYDKQLVKTLEAGLKKSSGLCLLPLGPIVEVVANLSDQDRERQIRIGDQVLADNVYTTVLHRLKD